MPEPVPLLEASGGLLANAIQSFTIDWR